MGEVTKLQPHGVPDEPSGQFFVILSRAQGLAAEQLRLCPPIAPSATRHGHVRAQGDEPQAVEKEKVSDPTAHISPAPGHSLASLHTLAQPVPSTGPIVP